MITSEMLMQMALAMSAISSGPSPSFVRMIVRFPRPAALTGREGVERFPPAADLPFDQAVARRLQALDPTIATGAIAELVAGHREGEVRQALLRTLRERAEGVMAYFTACLGRVVASERPSPRRGVPGVRDLPDPYA